MMHPFEKMFEKALAKSYGDENVVLGVAEKLMDKGYPPKEIFSVLQKLTASYIAPADEAIFKEALEEFEQYVED